MLAFSWTKTTLSTEDGAKELLFALMVNPAIEKTHSDGALVAGIAKMIRASIPSTVNLVCLNIYNTVQLKIETSIYCVGGVPTRKSAAAAAARRCPKIGGGGATKKSAVAARRDRRRALPTSLIFPFYPTFPSPCSNPEFSRFSRCVATVTMSSPIHQTVSSSR